MTRPLYVAIGIDCDPDRDTYPEALTWRGIEALPRLFEMPDVRWTLNVRADSQIMRRCGSARYCLDAYRHIWDAAERAGSEIAWHLHYFGDDERQDTSAANIHRNVVLGAEAMQSPRVVHMGWTFQSEESVRRLYEAGVRVDYSPVARLRFAGHGGVDQYDWSRFAYRPRRWHGVQMIPAYSFPHAVLSRRFGTERVMLTTTTAPVLYRSLLRSFFETGSDFFVSYFHADEIAGAVGGWRNRLYSLDHLESNLRALHRGAAQRGLEVRFVTISDLARILFDEDHARDA